MEYLYKLSLYDISAEYNEGFMIGIFSSDEKAETIAKKYIKEVSGFKDYPCNYEITKKKIIEESGDLQEVYMISGWNIDDNLDEIDIFESDLYTNINLAQSQLLLCKKEYKRTEWSLDKYRINELHWEEGFVKV